MKSELARQADLTFGNSVRSPERRAFLRALVRLPAAAGLAVLGGWLALRRVEPGVAEPCIKHRVCRGCQLLAGCERPQAVATREQS